MPGRRKVLRWLSLSPLALACSSVDERPSETIATPVPPVVEALEGIEERSEESVEELREEGAEEIAGHVPQALQEMAVYSDAPWRQTLWTWTSVDQLAGLQQDQRLLFRSESPTRGASRFDHAIAAFGDHAMTGLLRSPAFAARRFLWPNPLATTIGPADENYGTVLIRVELRPEAIVAAFDATAEPMWTFFTRDEEVPLSVVLNDPSKLAAVYHLHTAAVSFGSFREYVLVNESMVREWSIDPDERTAEFDRWQALSSSVSDHLLRDSGRDGHAWAAHVLTDIWPRATSTDHDVRSYWEATLSFLTQDYLPTVDAVGRLLARARQRPAPNLTLRVQPERTFELHPPNAVEPARIRPGRGHRSTRMQPHRDTQMQPAVRTFGQRGTF